MTKNEFKAGDKVLAGLIHNDWYGVDIVPFYFDPDYDSSRLQGTILKVKSAKALVKFEKNDWGFKQELVDLKFLVLQKDLPNIEVQYKQISELVKVKLQEAASIINEAGELAKQAKAGELSDMTLAIGPLIEAMDNNGWNSSSWDC